MTIPADTKPPSVERREEVLALWRNPIGPFDARTPSGFWHFVKLLDAQSAERTRAEVEKMREAAAKVAEGKVVQERYRTWPHWNPDGNLGSERGETRLALATAATIRALPIEGTPDEQETLRLR